MKEKYLINKNKSPRKTKKHAWFNDYATYALIISLKICGVDDPHAYSKPISSKYLYK